MAKNQDILFAQLEAALDYRFMDRRLLVEAITHRSYADQSSRQGMGDNQRMEFLGDAVLCLVVSGMLFRQFPDKAAGVLSRTRAALVDEASLAALADRLQLGRFMLLGRGEEKSGGRRKKSVLADAVEALIGAVYLDGGMTEAEKLVARIFGELFVPTAPEVVIRDTKTRLQELAHALRYRSPLYVLNDVSGPDHDLHFTVTVVVGDDCFAKGSGKTRKDAEQEAARKGILLLEEELRLQNPASNVTSS
jgi:ribonuclease III